MFFRALQLSPISSPLLTHRSSAPIRNFSALSSRVTIGCILAMFFPLRKCLIIRNKPDPPPFCKRVPEQLFSSQNAMDHGLMTPFPFWKARMMITPLVALTESEKRLSSSNDVFVFELIHPVWQEKKLLIMLIIVRLNKSLRDLLFSSLEQISWFIPLTHLPSIQSDSSSFRSLLVHPENPELKGFFPSRMPSLMPLSSSPPPHEDEL